MSPERAEINDAGQEFGTNIVSMSDIRAEIPDVESVNVRRCTDDRNCLEGFEREEEEELSNITYPEEDIFTSLVQFLEESARYKICLNNTTRKEDGTTEDDIIQKMKPAPQDVVLLGSTFALSSTSTNAIAQNVKSSIKAADEETKMKCKVWIWDELDSASRTSESLNNCQMLPHGELLYSSAVEEKERSFQTLVAKIRALREELSDKETIVASLEFTLNKSISSHSSTMMKQATRWNDILKKQDLDYDQVSPKVHYSTCNFYL
jgi:hypothetical protein